MDLVSLMWNSFGASVDRSFTHAGSVCADEKSGSRAPVSRGANKSSVEMPGACQQGARMSIPLHVGVAVEIVRRGGREAGGRLEPAGARPSPGAGGHPDYEKKSFFVARMAREAL